MAGGPSVAGAERSAPALGGARSRPAPGRSRRDRPPGRVPKRPRRPRAGSSSSSSEEITRSASAARRPVSAPRLCQVMSFPPGSGSKPPAPSARRGAEEPRPGSPPNAPAAVARSMSGARRPVSVLGPSQLMFTSPGRYQPGSVMISANPSSGRVVASGSPRGSSPAISPVYPFRSPPRASRYSASSSASGSASASASSWSSRTGVSVAAASAHTCFEKTSPSIAAAGPATGAGVSSETTSLAGSGAAPAHDDQRHGGEHDSEKGDVDRGDHWCLASIGGVCGRSGERERGPDGPPASVRSMERLPGAAGAAGTGDRAVGGVVERVGLGAGRADRV